MWADFCGQVSDQVEGHVSKVQGRLGKDRRLLAGKEGGIFDWWVSSAVGRRQGECERIQQTKPDALGVYLQDVGSCSCSRGLGMRGRWGLDKNLCPSPPALKGGEHTVRGKELWE